MKEVRKTERLMILFGFVGALMIVGVCLFGATDAFAETRKYIRVGASPVNPNAIYQGEEKHALDREVEVITTDRAGRHIRGWLREGEVLTYALEPSSGKWVATRIYKCGNPILNRIVWAGPPPSSAQPDIYLEEQEVGQPPSRPKQALQPPPAPVAQATAAAYAAPVATAKEKKCLGKGTIYTGIGSFMITGGIASGHPVGYGVAALGLIPTWWGLTDDDSRYECKAMAGLIGGTAGVFAGKAIDKELDRRDQKKEDRDRDRNGRPGPDPPGDPTLLPDNIGQYGSAGPGLNPQASF